MIRKIALTLAAAGALTIAATPAHAGGHVSLSLGVGLPAAGVGYVGPSYYGPPAPVYAPPVYAPPVIYAPAPVYGPYYGPRYYAPRYYGPQVVYRAYPGRGWHDRDGYRGDYRR